MNIFASLFGSFAKIPHGERCGPITQKQSNCGEYDYDGLQWHKETCVEEGKHHACIFKTYFVWHVLAF